MSSNDQQSPTTINNPDNKSTTTMNDLPNEVLLTIFTHFNIKDLIRCRQVSKRFMLFCDKTPELIVSNKIENWLQYWFHTNKQLNHKDAIDLRTFITYRSTFRCDKFLKRLHFKGSYSDYMKLNLNGLIHLEQLKIDVGGTKFGYRGDNRKRIDINLPNLKILEMSDDFTERFDIHLTAPKLEMLKCFRFRDTIYVYHPDSIIHFETVWHNETNLILKNIRYLKFDFEYIPNPDILSTYPKLTTLICNKRDYGRNYGIHELVESKRILKRNELKIFYQCVEIVDRSTLDKYDPTDWTQVMVQFQINNYDSLCGNISSAVIPLDYHDVVYTVNGTTTVNGKLPQDLHNKFINTEFIRIFSKVDSEMHLLQFLKRLPYLENIDVGFTHMDQTFYDCLHEISQLKELNVYLSPIANYDFLYHLKCLETFHIYNPEQDSVAILDLACGLFRELKYFRQFMYYSTNEFTYIVKDDDGTKFEFKHKKNQAIAIGKRGMNFDQLVSFVNAYENDNRSD